MKEILVVSLSQSIPQILVISQQECLSVSEGDIICFHWYDYLQERAILLSCLPHDYDLQHIRVKCDCHFGVIHFLFTSQLPLLSSFLLTNSMFSWVRRTLDVKSKNAIRMFLECISWHKWQSLLPAFIYASKNLASLILLKQMLSQRFCRTSNSGKGYR